MNMKEIENSRKLRSIFEKTPTDLLKEDFKHLPEYREMIERELGGRSDAKDRVADIGEVM